MVTRTGLRSALTMAAAALLLSACSAPVEVGPIHSVTFHQYQSTPDFDTEEYTMSTPAELGRLHELFERFGVTPGETITADEDRCDGGLSTTLTVELTSGSSADMFIADCGKPEFDEFNASANDLFTEWRKQLSGR